MAIKLMLEFGDDFSNAASALALPTPPFGIDFSSSDRL